jgi:hypothetical protein
MALRRVAGKCVAALVAAGLTGMVQADITIEQQIDVDGFGPSKFGAMEGHSSTAISGNKSRTEQQTQFKSRLLRALAKSANTNTVRIVRLDAEVVDEIDVANKQYSEVTFQQMRDATTKALQDAQSQPARQQQEAPSGAPVDDSKCQWSPPRSELKQSGEHASIAGTDTSRATITVTTTCTDPTKGTSCDFVFVMDEWLAADVPGTAETREFWRNYARKVGLTGDVNELQGNSQAVFNRYKSGWGEAMKQAGSLKGFPLKTVAAMQFGGPQCKDDSSNTGGSNAGSSDSSSASSVPTSPSAAIGSAALGLFSKMHKKDDSQQTAAAAPVAPGMVQMFQMSTQTVAIRSDSIPAGTFEVPAGFKRVDKAQ